jgi:hypothetical protein
MGVIGSISGLPVWDPSNTVLFLEFAVQYLSVAKRERESNFQLMFM